MPKNSKDLRLHGISFEDALKRLVTAPPPPKKKAPKAAPKSKRKK